MARVSKAIAHLSAEQVLQKIQTATNFRQQQKWLVVYNALVDPRPAAEIARHTGTSIRTVHQVISDYNRLGAAAIETPGKGGRNNSYLSLEAEKEFISSFTEQAAVGSITTATKIKQAFEELVGKEVDKSTIYRLLQRQEWRKRMPRPSHPEANSEVQEAFKKTFPHSCNKLYKLETAMIPDQCYCWQPTREDLVGWVK
jgi:transposase